MLFALRGEELLRGDRRIGPLGEDAALLAQRSRLAGEERGEIRLDVAHRRDGRARALDGRAAIDGDARGDRIERVHRGAVEPLEELPRVRAEALDETPLAFGVQRVERERRLARAAEAGDGDERTGLEIEIDPLQVVGPSAAKTNGMHRDRKA